MPQIRWSSEMTTGITPLDQLHRALLETMSDATSIADENFVDYYSDLLKKVESAFINEEQCIESADPALLKLHREQHADVLGALHNVHRKVLDGDFKLGRKVVEDLLPQWYAAHILTMEMVLAITIQECGIQIPALTPQPSGMYFS